MRGLSVVALVCGCGGGGHGASVDSNTGDGSPFDGYNFDGTTNAGTWIPGGTLVQSATWTTDMCPIHVQSSLTVGGPTAGSGPVVLTIEPGCTVLFGTQLTLDVSTNGALRAVGTISAPIMFANDRLSAGWSGLRFIDLSPAVETRLERVLVDGAQVGLQVSKDHPTIVSSMFQNSRQDGIDFQGSAGFGASSASVSSVSNGAYGVELGIGSSDQLPAADFSGNALGAALIHGGVIATSTTWTNIKGTYVLADNLKVEGASAPSLTLQPGVVVSSGTVQVGSLAAGSLHALGTQNAPVRFTGAPGWSGVWLYAMAVGSELDNTVIDNARDGLFVYDITPSLKGVAITTQYSGINLRGTAALSADSTALVVHAGYLAVDAGVQAIPTLPATNSDYGGAGSQIWIEGGTVTTSGTWHMLGPPYIVYGMVTIQSAASPVVTIEAGTKLEFFHSAGLTVGDSSAGGLIAQGTALAPIVFTGTTPSAGYWAGLMFGTGTTASSVIGNSIVEWGGEGGFNGYASDVDVFAGTGPAIHDSTIWRSAGYGVHVSCQSVTTAPAMTNLTFGTGADANAAGDLVKLGCQ